MVQQMPKSIKAQITRASLVIAAAGILREQGPEGVTYRQVAKIAGVSPSSTGYYFSSISDLLSEAGTFNIKQWALRAEKIVGEVKKLTADQVEKQAIDLLIRACLPSEPAPELTFHYRQLIAVSDSEEVTAAYRAGRERLDQAVQYIIDRLGWPISARLLIAIVDGAAVAAISEGLSVRENVASLLNEVRCLPR